jgi:hypothetical protein
MVLRSGRVKLLRVLTTSGRKPPLRTGKFLGFRGEWLPQGLRYRAKVRRIRLLRTHRSPKRPHEQPRSGESGPKWRGQTTKAQFLASKPPTLTEVFGPMWLARDHPLQFINFASCARWRPRTGVIDNRLRRAGWEAHSRRLARASAPPRVVEIPRRRAGKWGQ